MKKNQESFSIQDIDSEHYNELAKQADVEMGKRSISSAFIYFGFVLAAIFASPYARDYPTVMLVVGAAILIIGAERLYLALSLKKFYPLRMALWRKLFFIGVILIASCWGIFSCLTIALYGLSAWTTFLVILMTAGASAAAITSLSPNLSLLRWYLIFMLVPSLVTSLIMGGKQGYSIAFLIVFFLFFLMIQGKNQNREYWRAITNNARLDIRTRKLEEAKEIAEAANRKLKTEIAERERAEESLQHQVEFEELITTISTNFINLATDEIDSGINHALQSIGEFSSVDRSYIFLFPEDRTRMDNTHEWCAEGIEPQIDNLKELSVDISPWWMKKLNRFETIHIPRVVTLPPEASAEKEILQSQDIQSLVVVPLVYGKSLIGFLGFDSVREEKKWSENIIALLKMVGDMFVNALEHKWVEAELFERQKRLKAINEMTIELAGTFDLNRLLQTIIDRARELVQADVGVIILIDPDTGAIGNAFASNYPMDKIPPGTEVQGQGVLGRIVAGEVIYTEDVTQESGYIGYPSWHLRIHACIGLPVQSAGKIQALLLLGHRDEQFRFSDDDREVAQTLVNFAAVAIHTARQFGKLENLTSFQRNILDTAATAVFTVNAEQHITSVNTAFCEITGFSEEEVLGQHCDVLNGTPCMKRCGLYNPERTESIYRRQCEITSKDGQRLTILKNANLLYDEQGNVTGGIESFVDVTELIEARKVAEAANRAKSEFLANMSHEIRTPMNGVIGMTELALDTELTDEQREYLTTVQSSAHAMLDVLNDILDISKIEAGKLDLEVINFDLRTTVEETAELLAQRAHKKGLELACHIKPEVPTLLTGDPTRLRQILVNLIGNAIKFTEEGEVVIQVSLVEKTEEKVRLQFSVSDTGIGITPDKQAMIFEIFAQADGSTTRKYGGTGLGLAISKQLTEMMDGQIWLESELGRGSTFYFTAEFGFQEEPSLVVFELPVDISGLPVLVVDDNETNRVILVETLSAFDLSPTAVADGQQALSALWEANDKGTPFRLVLLDMCMPDIDGFEVAECIRANKDISKVPIILMTSAGERGDAARSKEIGINAYLLKPVKRADLLDAIKSVLSAQEQKLDEKRLITRHTIAESRRSKARILLTEDDAVNQRLTVAMLTKRGYQVEIAENGRKALEALDGGVFDLVLMDVQMPEMDGIEATIAIRNNPLYKDLPIIAMTAHAMKGDREKCLEAGMNDYVSKPINRDELFETVEKWVSEVKHGVISESPADLTEEETTRTETSEQSPEPINMEIAMEQMDGDTEFLKELLEMFFSTVPLQVTQLRLSIKNNDAEQVRHVAHNIKGSAGNLAMEHVQQLALELENMGNDNDLAQAEDTLALLEAELERAQEFASEIE